MNTTSVAETRPKSIRSHYPAVHELRTEELCINCTGRVRPTDIDALQMPDDEDKPRILIHGDCVPVYWEATVKQAKGPSATALRRLAREVGIVGAFCEAVRAAPVEWER